MGPAGDFFAVYPEADFAIDGADVVVVPLVDAFGQVFGWEAAIALWADGREGIHTGAANGEDVAVAGEPVAGFVELLFVDLAIAEVENLDFNTGWEFAFSGFEFLDGLGMGPDKDARVAAVFLVFPLADELEVGEGFVHADDSFGRASAVGVAVFPAPGVFVAVDVDEVFTGKGDPAGSFAGDVSGFERSGLVRVEGEGEGQGDEDEEGGFHGDWGRWLRAARSQKRERGGKR